MDFESKFSTQRVGIPLIILHSAMEQLVAHNKDS